MKAIIISALLFFSVRAMSETATVGQDLKGPCEASVQSNRATTPKVIVEKEKEKEEVKKEAVAK